MEDLNKWENNTMHSGGSRQATFLLILWVYLLPMFGISALQQSAPQESAEPDTGQSDEQYSFSVDVEEVTVRNSEARPEVPVAVQNRKSLGYRSGLARCSNWSGWIRSPGSVDVWRC